MIKRILISLLFFSSFYAFSQKKENTVIINNEASSSTQAITAPALISSPAKNLRNHREKQEIETEDRIIKELEKQRLLDEQKRLDKFFGNNKAQKAPPSTVSSSEKTWYFGNKAFISGGAGFVTYPGVKNLNSMESPAWFFSFGAYGYGHIIFDLSMYYSKHYLKTPNKNYSDIREMVKQPAMAMSIKYSPLAGNMKPYVGASASLVYRKWGFIHKSGAAIKENSDIWNVLKDVADKKWNQSFDAGLALGADIALGNKVGLNLDVRYYVNVYTENQQSLEGVLTDAQILDKRDSIILSGNLRYYF